MEFDGVTTHRPNMEARGEVMAAYRRRHFLAGPRCWREVMRDPEQMKADAAAFYDQPRVDVRRSLADGDLAVLHCHQTWPGNHDYARIDTFRSDDDGRIVEHWDVLQVIPETAANDNGMF
jgi:predicted SnoaL-like aldol condensation-catalyzing enzyme